MRKRFRVLILAALIAAVVVPVGFALSRDTGPMTVASSMHGATTPIVASTISTSRVGIATERPVPAPLLPSIPDGAKLFLVGTVLFGLAAAMRRSA
jgi:hypothetical protein